MQIELGGTRFHLLPQKAIYQPDTATLVIADVHLGKVNHFRKSGIPLAAQAQMDDYKRLEALFLRLEPARVCFLGDLFHSYLNLDWHHFRELRATFPQISFTLVKGNHDVIAPKLFAEIGVTVLTEPVTEGDVVYSHEPLENCAGINICGHIHPGVSLSGKARQHLQLPCFYYARPHFILPAFGNLTGLYKMPLNKSSRAYVVLNEEVREI